MAYLGVSICLLAVCGVYASIIENVQSSSRIPSEYLVNVRPNIMKGESLRQKMDLFEQKMAAFSQAIKVLGRFDFNKLSVLHIKSESEVLVSGLFSFPEVSSIEVDDSDYSLDETDDECIDQTAEDFLWGLARISQRTKTSDNTYSYKGDDGEGGVAYVDDSGILLTHSEFGGRASHGFTATNIGEEPETDFRGHGSHNAGIIVGATYGVAKAAQAVAVKVISRFGGSSKTNAVEGLRYAFDDFTSRDAEAGGNFPAVVSMSLRYTNSSTIDGVMQEMFDVGLISVASAGNNGESACNQSPARAEAAITVMASDTIEGLSSFSNYGSCADVIAPGVSVQSVGVEHDEDSAVMTGTSKSATHVAGVVLRYLTQTIKETGVRPSPAEVKEWIVNVSTKDVIDIKGRPDTNNYLLYAPCDLTSL